MKGIHAAFCGRLGRDAEIRTAKSGRQWLSLSAIAGEDDDAQWVSIACFSETIAAMAGQLTKGTEVYIEGNLRLRTWEAQDGPRTTLSVSASLVQPLALIGMKKPKAPRAAKTRRKVDANAPVEAPFNDGLPF